MLSIKTNLKLCNLAKNYPFTKHQILDYPKLKAFAHKKLVVNETFTFVLGRVENIVEKKKEKMLGYQHFLLFPQCL